MTTRTLPTGSRDLVTRVVDWLIAAVVMLVILAIVGTAAAVAGSSIYYEVTKTKAGEMDELIKRELPIGVPAASVISFLDSKDIEHGAAAPAGANDLKVLEAGIPRGTMVIPAVVRNEGYGIDLGNIEMSLLLDTTDVQMRFILDEAGNLKGVMVYEEHDRPTMVDLNAGKSED